MFWRPMNDKEKILAILKDRNDNGIHSFELMDLVKSNRVAARINELREEGYSILSTPEKRGDSVGTRYYLTEILEDSVKTSKAPQYKFEFYTDSEGRSMARRVQV